MLKDLSALKSQVEEIKMISLSTAMIRINQSIFWTRLSLGVAGAVARVESSKHLDPLQQRTDALLGCQGETN